MSSDLLKIKDKYGEKMMHLCRKQFSTILEEEGKLFSLLSDHFAFSKSLYEDIVNNSLEEYFKDYIYSLLEPIKDLPIVDKSPEELLDDVGYILYECKTESDVQSFSKYYQNKEKLCTFRGGRLNKCYVFFAVKKNAMEINREYFLNPLRQDRYGTSVISIQFTRGENNTLSIKNRYNHSVTNPDATYSNNLENIAPGLTKSFEKCYGLNICQNNLDNFEIPGYVKASDGKFYKYNYEINNIYYCENNIIVDNYEVITKYQEKEKYLIVDYFIIDLVNKKISLYDQNLKDSFVDDFNNVKKIDINKNRNSGYKILNIIFDDNTNANIVIDKYNRMISYTNKNVRVVGDNYLSNNIFLNILDISNVMNIGDYFLSCNTMLSNIDISNVMKIGLNCLFSNKLLTKINLPKLLEVKDNFLYENKILNSINALKLIKVGNNFLFDNNNLIIANMSSLEIVGDYFIAHNIDLDMLAIPNLISVGKNFLCANKKINYLYLPRVRQVGDSFLYCNRELKQLTMENLEIIGDNFLPSNRVLELVFLPKLMFVGSKFLYKNNSLIMLELSSLIKVGRYFLSNNNSLVYLYGSRLEYVGSYFLTNNNVLQFIDLSSLKEYGNCFLSNNIDVKKRVLGKI